ncbi:MAG TPA: 5-formyltetrahydrofolate cyclo-ligase [Psychromonas hadalis]|nr:5-formyltetrahydrofolate cyclo-ligase [Psychromonas hadalis]
MINRQRLRKKLRVLRRSLSNAEQKKSARKILCLMTVHPRVIASKHIAIFLSNDGEIETTQFIDWCWENGKSIYLPVIHPFTKDHLLFLKYTPKTELIKNRYGILEPKLNVKTLILSSQLDLVFAPLVAFDKQGNRIGMGGGYYDRLLSDQNTSPYPIGLAHDCQLIPAVPIDSWDIPLPEIITPSHHHIFTKN